MQAEEEKKKKDVEAKKQAKKQEKEDKKKVLSNVVCVSFQISVPFERGTPVDAWQS